MEGPQSVGAPPCVRGPPCVALASPLCQADPRRVSNYTPVPDEYRMAEQLDDNACVCSSNHCHRKVGLKPPPGQPGRPTSAKRGRGQESPLADVSGRAPSPSARQQPACVIDVFQIKAVRRTAIDSERHTTDEAVHDARQNNLPPNAPNEYLVHGEFKTGPDSRGFPDTYYFTIAELHAADLTKDCIVSKIQEFEGQLKVQLDNELAELQQHVHVEAEAEAEAGG